MRPVTGAGLRMARMRERYARFFALAIVLVSGGASYAFSRIGDEPPPPRLPHFRDASPEDSALASSVVPIAPPLEAYERFAAEDAAWRKRHARQLSLSEVQARGDWRPRERQALDDRVHALSKRGRHAEAVAVLEQWLDKHPRDEDALLTLARLLSQTNRTDEAAVRYRQLIAMKSGGS